MPFILYCLPAETKENKINKTDDNALKMTPNSSLVYFFLNFYLL